ncbi:MAG: minor capsid protein [Eubacteriales bacterium]
MAKISTRVTFDKSTAMARIKAANNKALFTMGQQALKDANMHVPIDQHTLEESGITNSDDKAVDGKYNLIWATPYAQYLWNGEVMYGNPMSRTYGPEKLKFTSALAKMEWAKYAKEVYGSDWKKTYQTALELELVKS